MAAKKFVLRIDEKMYEALEKWASDEFRSVNGQIEWIIRQQLLQADRWKKKDDAGGNKNKPGNAAG